MDGGREKRGRKEVRMEGREGRREGGREEGRKGRKWREKEKGEKHIGLRILSHSFKPVWVELRMVHSGEILIVPLAWTLSEGGVMGK